MCVVSMIGDHYKNEKLPKWPTSWPSLPWEESGTYPVIPVDQAEFDRLKKEVEELKQLIKMAKIIDSKTGQKNCQHDDKFELLKKIAKQVGVDLGV